MTDCEHQSAVQRAGRWREEQAFHDAWAAGLQVDQLDVLGSFGGVTDPENRYAIRTLGEVRGRRILDLGSGAGVASTYFALQQASVVPVDISFGMLSRAQLLARRYCVEGRVHPCRAVAEFLPFRGGSFDAVYGYGILHHADLLLTLREVRRVLRPAGKAVFIEPLGLNPVVNAYRRLSRGVRTSGERPLMPSDLAKVAGLFPGSHHREVQLFSLLVHVWMALTGRFRLQRDRPWIIIVQQRRSYARAFSLLQRLDKHLLRVAPAAGLLSWATVLVMEKAQTVY